MTMKVRSSLTFANVTSMLALFVALGGSSYAAIKVTGKNVKDSSLTGKDIKNSSLGTADVKNGNLLVSDFKAGQLPAGPQGPRGLTGPQGSAGPPGAQGSPGIAGLERTVGTSPANTSGSPKIAIAACSPGKEVIGTGAHIEGGKTGDDPNGTGLTNVVITRVIPHQTNVEVWAYEEEPTAANWELTAYALCARVSP